MYVVEMEKMDKKLDYLIKMNEGILSEQEKQRISLMSIEEIQEELLKNNKEMREKIDVLLDKVDEHDTDIDKLYKVM